MEAIKIRSTSKYPTTLIVRGLNPLGVEIAKRLIEQKGYVIIIDSITEQNINSLDDIEDKSLLTVLDIKSINSIDNDLRRLDYVFYFEHDTSNFIKEISTQDFLQKSNYLDAVLDLTTKFKARFLLTTSIKAHQLVIENSSIDLNKSFEPIPKYSETEAQRYAENLVSEYQTKMNLDSRIIRIGELLGKGMNLSTDSKYIDLMTSAIEGRGLNIPGDGLESDFYIHYVDAARGLIHSMFNMSLKGKIFSLSIPEEISILSIAYKIADIVKTAGEIKFTDYDSKLPPLRLYKPAPNLNTTGWNHKININRSISASIDYMKDLSVSEKKDEIVDDRGDFKDTSPETTNIHGALARLVADRKQQEKSRMGSVVVANEELRKKMKKNVSFKDRIDKGSFWFFHGLKNKFTFLKNITLKEFILSGILLVIFFIIYINLIAPILNIVSNLYLLDNNLNNISENLDASDYDKVADYIFASSDNIKQIQERLSNISYIFTLSGKNDYYVELQNSLDIQYEFSQGIGITYSSLSPLLKYINSKNFELIERISNDESLLDVEIINDQTYISEMKSKEADFKLGIDKLKLTKDKIIPSLKIFPDNIQTIFTQKVENIINSVDSIIEKEDSYQYIPDLLGADNQTNYLFLIQDEYRPTPGGGEVVGFINITYENGLITDIISNTIDKVELRNINLNNLEINESNLLSTKTITNETFIVNDISTIKDLDIRSNLTKKIFENFLSKNINVIGWVNTSSLNYLIYDTIQIGSSSINNSNYNDELIKISGENISNRDYSIINLFNNVLINSNSNIELLKLVSSLNESINREDIRFYSEDLKLKSFFNQFQINTFRDYISIGMQYKDTITSIEPKLTFGGEINVSDSNSIKDLKLNSNVIDEIEFLWICTPSGSSNFSIPSSNVAYYSRNFSTTEVCNIYRPNESTGMSLGYSYTNFENSDSSIYNYLMSFTKPFGVNTEYEIRFIFDSTKSVESEVDPTIKRINDFTFNSNDMTQSLNFKFYYNE